MPRGTIYTYEQGEELVVEWRISEFSMSSQKDGAYYYSPQFSFGGERWWLVIWPNGRREYDSSGYVDVRLLKDNSGCPIRVSTSLWLKTAKGNKSKEELSLSKNFNNYHSFYRFISREELSRRRSELLPNDVLTVVCTMKGSTSAGSNTCVEACTQTEKHELRQVYTQTEKQEFREASTQTVGERYYNCREKLLMALCIASIIIVVVTGCVLAYFKTPSSSSHPGREAVTRIETSEIKITITGSEIDGSVSNEIGDADVPQSEEVNKAAELTLTDELDDELNKADHSEIVGSDNPVTSVANQAHTDETDESKGASKIQTSVNNRSNVVDSNEYEASGSNVTSATDIKEDEGINKTLAAEMNEIDNSEIAASDISETSTTNQADSAEKDELDHNLPKDHDKQLVLYVSAVITLVIAIACVHHYLKTSLSATHAYGEDNLEQNSENTSMEPCIQMAEENEERDWMTDVLEFLIAGNGIDVTFEVETPNGHVEFFAHKLILAMRSPFFADEFYGEGKSDAHLVIPLKGVNPKAFMEMLRYCYDNKPRMRTIEEACILFKIASDFKILNLQKICHTFIKDAKIDP